MEYSKIKIVSADTVLIINVPTIINFEWSDSFLKFRFVHKSKSTVNPIPPVIKRPVMTRLTIGSPTYCDRLSDHREKPALLKAEIVLNKL